jgi:hypothetical protein
MAVRSNSRQMVICNHVISVNASTRLFSLILGIVSVVAAATDPQLTLDPISLPIIEKLTTLADQMSVEADQAQDIETATTAIETE